MWKSQKYIIPGFKDMFLTCNLLSSVSRNNQNKICNIYNHVLSKRKFSFIPYLKQKKQTNLYKDIYKEVGYKSPFDTDENNLILKTINEAKSAEQLSEFVAKPKAAILFDHIKTHGEIKIVEELLSVKKFDDRILERLGKKILKSYVTNDETQNCSETIRESEMNKPNKSNKQKISKYIKPRLTKDVYQEIESIVGVKISFYDITFTHLDTQKEQILSWDSLDSLGSKSASEHPRLFQTATEIVSQIPHADLYFIEEQLPILQGKNQANLKSNVSLLELQSAMVTLLNVRNCGAGCLSNENEDSDGYKETPTNCVHLMKYNVIDDMFQLKIGTERVALQTRLFSGEDSIFNTHEAFKGITFSEDFDTIVDKYFRSQLFTKYAKEHLGITLMMVAALHSSMMPMSSSKT